MTHEEVKTAISYWSQAVLDIQDLTPKEMKQELEMLHRDMEEVFEALNKEPANA